ncbi:helix-turn-helix domain-containing protein [Bradyrhizobium diazoefficiens]|uniref:helix-turn-helix domain-containing protein n=1 Tax=Bradyrhizobium diazoefficiens TaxID=1355477 RepID=UPI0011785F53|nr:helix-turn-helix transcriptional regulator [Bradyrhizobium diazoefficiens]QLD43867.1 helix-turn-helix transcriptional regulator [Bradyrhizobium diazoefficiens]
MIRRAREMVGESQAAFGARFDVDQSTVHRWETKGPPTRGPARRALETEISRIAALSAPGMA